MNKSKKVKQTKRERDRERYLNDLKAKMDKVAGDRVKDDGKMQLVRFKDDGTMEHNAINMDDFVNFMNFQVVKSVANLILEPDSCLCSIREKAFYECWVDDEETFNGLIEDAKDYLFTAHGISITFD